MKLKSRFKYTLDIGLQTYVSKIIELCGESVPDYSAQYIPFDKQEEFRRLAIDYLETYEGIRSRECRNVVIGHIGRDCSVLVTDETTMNRIQFDLTQILSQVLTRPASDLELMTKTTKLG